MIWAGVFLALLSTVLINTSFFYQHRAMSRAERLSLAHPVRSAGILLHNPQWCVAYAGGWVGWAVYIAALRLAPLSVVQALAAAGLPLLAVLARRSGAVVATRELVAAGAGALGIVLICSTLGSSTSGGRADLTAVLAFVGAGVVVGGLVAALGRRVLHPGAALGIASGILYAVADVATKGAVDGTGAVLVPVFLVASAFGFVALQAAFQRGGVLQTAGLSSVIMTVVPIAAGIGLFHEKIPSGPLGYLRILGFALSVLAAALLSARGQAVGLELRTPSNASTPRSA